VCPGRSPGGAAQVKSHTFFAGIQFEAVRRQQAPYVPHLRYATDTSHFDTGEDGLDVDRAVVRRTASLDSVLSASNNNNNNTASAAVTGPAAVAAGPCDGGRHAFLEFTFRRFFDADGHAHATRLTDGPAPVYV